MYIFIFIGVVIFLSFFERAVASSMVSCLATIIVTTSLIIFDTLGIKLASCLNLATVSCVLNRTPLKTVQSGAAHWTPAC